MPLYDVAAGIKPAEPFTALSRARTEKSQRRMMEAQALVMETNVANSDRDYELESRKVDIAAGRNDIDAGELSLKYDQYLKERMNGFSEGEQRANAYYEDMQVTYANMYDQAIQEGGDETTASQVAQEAIAPMLQRLPPQLRQSLPPPDYRVASALRASQERGITQDMREVNIGGTWQELPVNFDSRSGRNFITGQDGERQYLDPSQIRDSTKRAQTGPLSRPEIANYRSGQTAARNYLSLVNRTIQMINESPDANTLVARGAGIFEMTKYEVNAALRATGISNDPTLEESSTYEGVFSKLGLLGESNARMRSMITTLAYTAASALAGQEGREVSNAEVARFIEAIGAGASRPETFKKVLLDTAVTVDTSIRNQFITLSRDSPDIQDPGDMGLEAIKTMVNKGDGWSTLPDGTPYRKR